MLYSAIRYGAIRRGIDFDLSLEHLSKLISSPCHYCMYCGGNRFCNNGYPGESYRHNGIDRVDNMQGYTLTNCVSCCKVCNRSKSNMSLAQWHDWIRRIARYADVLEAT